MASEYEDEKNASSEKEEDDHIMKDHTGRIWMGQYPMNELVGSKINSDIQFAAYDADGVAVVDGERYLRMPVVRENTSEKDILGVVKVPSKSKEITGYRYFKFNAIPWKIVEQRGKRLTLCSEYVIDYKAFDEDKYLKMTDKEISRIKTGIYWESSKIREWLNGVFVRRAFLESERQKLQVTEISTPVSTLSDRTTYDKVYLPSIEEIRYGFDVDYTLQRGKKKTTPLFEEAPYSQYVVAEAEGHIPSNCFGLRSRGTIDSEDSYKCNEGFEGHALLNNKLFFWPLNKGAGIRPIICINEDDVVEMP